MLTCAKLLPSNCANTRHAPARRPGQLREYTPCAHAAARATAARRALSPAQLRKYTARTHICVRNCAPARATAARRAMWVALSGRASLHALTHTHTQLRSLAQLRARRAPWAALGGRASLPGPPAWRVATRSARATEPQPGGAPPRSALSPAQLGDTRVRAHNCTALCRARLPGRPLLAPPPSSPDGPRRRSATPQPATPSLPIPHRRRRSAAQRARAPSSLAAALADRSSLLRPASWAARATT